LLSWWENYILFSPDERQSLGIHGRILIDGAWKQKREAERRRPGLAMAGTSFCLSPFIGISISVLMTPAVPVEWEFVAIVR